MASDTLLYFAYGSMCNPTSLSRRGLHPSSSQPAVLHGYQLAFQLGGMANIVEVVGDGAAADSPSSTHGVLHRVTLAEFQVLREIESNYETAELPVTPYSSSSNSPDAATATTAATVTATAFIVRPPAIAAMMQQHPEWGSSLPSDRYLRIITAGLRHYGADAAWVEWVAAQPCKHGRQPHDYLKLPLPPPQQQPQAAAAGEGCSASSSHDRTPPQQEENTTASAASLPTFSMAQLASHEGQLRDHRCLFALGPKVVQVDVSSKPDAPFVKIIQQHFSGKQVAFHMCMVLYEPRLPPLASPADVRQEHIAWAEDAVVEWLAGHNYDVQQVGWLEGGGVGGAAGGAEADAAVVRDAAEALHEEDEATTAPDTGVFV